MLYYQKKKKKNLGEGLKSIAALFKNENYWSHVYVVIIFNGMVLFITRLLPLSIAQIG